MASSGARCLSAASAASRSLPAHAPQSRIVSGKGRRLHLQRTRANVPLQVVSQQNSKASTGTAGLSVGLGREPMISQFGRNRQPSTPPRFRCDPSHKRPVFKQAQLSHPMTWIMNWESSASYPEKIADTVIGEELVIIEMPRHWAPNQLVARVGTVNLSRSGSVGITSRRQSDLGNILSTHAADFRPDLECLGPVGSVLGGSDVISTEMEQVVDLIVG